MAPKGDQTLYVNGKMTSKIVARVLLFSLFFVILGAQL
jgi:hypothetical protein